MTGFHQRQCLSKKSQRRQCHFRWRSKRGLRAQSPSHPNLTPLTRRRKKSLTLSVLMASCMPTTWTPTKSQRRKEQLTRLQSANRRRKKDACSIRSEIARRPTAVPLTQRKRGTNLSTCFCQNVSKRSIKSRATLGACLKNAIATQWVSLVTSTIALSRLSRAKSASFSSEMFN